MKTLKTSNTAMDEAHYEPQGPRYRAPSAGWGPLFDPPSAPSTPTREEPRQAPTAPRRTTALKAGTSSETKETDLERREREAREARARAQERLLPVVVAEAARMGPEGITAADVISAGIAAGILPPSPTGQRAYSWTGPWLSQLARQGVLRVVTVHGIAMRRRSERERSHGNLGVVYTLAERAA